MHNIQDKNNSSKILKRTCTIGAFALIAAFLLFGADIYFGFLMLSKELWSTNSQFKEILDKSNMESKNRVEFLKSALLNSNDKKYTLEQFLKTNVEVKAIVYVQNGSVLQIGSHAKNIKLDHEIIAKSVGKHEWYLSDIIYQNGILTRFRFINLQPDSYLIIYEDPQYLHAKFDQIKKKSIYDLVVFDRQGFILSSDKRASIYDKFHIDYDPKTSMSMHITKDFEGRYFFTLSRYYSDAQYGVISLKPLEKFIKEYMGEAAILLLMILIMLYIFAINIKFFSKKIITPIEELKEIFSETSPLLMQDIADIISSKNSDLGYIASKIIAFYQDLGDANSEIKFTSEKLGALLKNNFIVILILDPYTGKIIEANDSACELYGYSQSEFNHLDIFDITSDTSYEYSYQKLLGAQKGLKYFIGRHTCEDGRIKDVQIQSSLLDSGNLIFIMFDITSYEKYRYDTQRERTYVSDGPFVMLIFDIKTFSVKRVTKNIQRLWGYTHESILKPEFDFLSIVHPQDLTRVKKELRNRFETLKSKHDLGEFFQTYRIKYADNQFYFHQICMKLVQIKGDENSEIVGYFANFNEFFRQNEMFKKDIQRYKNILDATSAIAWEWEIGRPNFYINENFAKLLGYNDPFSFNQTVFDKFKAMIAPSDTPLFEAQLYNYINGFASNLSIQMRISDKLGYLVWIRFQGKITARDENGKATYMCGTIENITLEKEQESQLKLIASVFSYSHEGIVITDPNGNIIDVNSAFTKITGYERAEVIGKNPNILKSDRHDTNFYVDMWRSLMENGFYSGEIWNKRKNGSIYPEILTISAVTNEQNEVIRYVAIFSEISSIKEKEAKLERIASYDFLTGLANRMTFKQKVLDAMRICDDSGENMAVCYIDFDGFKKINDTYGHKMGDIYLKAVADKMQGVLRQSDTLARLGGDEFGALITSLSVKDDVIVSVNRLLEAANTNFSVSNINLQASASIGISFYEGGDTIDYDEVIRRADAAMYKAKVSGKNRYEIYEPQKSQNFSKEFSGENFFVVYQGVFDIISNSITSIEALLRYESKDGTLLPGEFLHALDDDKLREKVSMMCINKALEMNLKLRFENGIDIFVSVNLSTKSVMSDSFFLLVKNFITTNLNFNPTRLIIELTDVSFEHIKELCVALQRYKNLGIKFMLNDANLATLKEAASLGLWGVKSSPRLCLGASYSYENIKELKAMTEFCQKNSLVCVAIGVENSACAKLLAGLGFRYMQGSMITAPLLFDEVGSAQNELAKRDRIIPMNEDEFFIFIQAIKHKFFINQFLECAGKDSLKSFDLKSYEKEFALIIKRIKSRKLGKDEIVIMLHTEINKQILGMLSHEVNELEKGLYELKISSDELINIL